MDDVVEGRRSGYNADERTWAGDWWHHRILVIPAIGTDANGGEVRGYWYDYAGGGTFAPTTKRTTGVMKFIRARLDGTATVVTNPRDGQYETDGRAYLGLKRDARDILSALRRAPASSNANRLNELKTMYAHGRESRDVFVTADVACFGEPDSKRRRELSMSAATAIMSFEEFKRWCVEQRAN